MRSFSCTHFISLIKKKKNPKKRYSALLCIGLKNLPVPAPSTAPRSPNFLTLGVFFPPFCQKLTNVRIMKENMRTGNLPANMKKNRVLQIIPCKDHSPTPNSSIIHHTGVASKHW